MWESTGNFSARLIINALYNHIQLVSNMYKTNLYQLQALAFQIKKSNWKLLRPEHRAEAQREERKSQLK